MKALILLLAMASGLMAQKTSYPNVVTTFFDNNGLACGLCTLNTYIAGTTTNQATFTTPGGGVANANPIVLNAGGSANVWLTPGLSYRFDLFTAAAVLIWSKDNIPGGTIAGLSTVTANTIYSGPTSGGAATPAFRALVQADIPAIAPTVCTNQFLSQISASIVGTCRSVLGTDFGAAIAARSVLGNNTAAGAAPVFGTTVDALAYQVAEMPAFVNVAADFTTAVSTALQNITGLTWTIPANTAVNMPFVCRFIWHQNTAAVAVAFGIQDVTISPTSISAMGVMYTNVTAATQANLVNLTTTTATAIVSATPSAITTDWVASVSGFIEAPSNASSSAINIMVSTAVGADAVVIRRGSFCRLN